MIGRFLLGLVAALFLATGASAVPPVAPILVGPPTFSPPTPSIAKSGWFGWDNGFFTSFGTLANNATLAFPTGATYVPTASVLNSWVLTFVFRTPDATGGENTNLHNIGGAASTTGCPTANNSKCFGVQSGNNANPFELLLNINSGNTTQGLWTPNGGIGVPRTGILLKPATVYTVILAQHGVDAVGGATSGTMSLCVIDTNGNPVGGSCILATTINNSNAAAGFYYSAASTLQTQAGIGDILNKVGASIASTTTMEHGVEGPFSNVMMCWGDLPNTSGVPTAAIIQGLGNGTVDPKTWCTTTAGVNGHLRSLYRLNDAGTWAGDPAGDIMAAATVSVTAAYKDPNSVNYPVAGSPLVPNPCLRVNERGATDVFRAEPNQTVNANATGTIYIRGTYSTKYCRGTPYRIQGRILSYGTTTVLYPWINITGKVSGGAFTGKYPGVKVGGPYMFQIRASNSTGYIYSSGWPIYIGWVEYMWGRSQICFMVNSAPNGGTGANLQPSNGVTSSVVNMALTDAGSQPSNHGASYAPLMPLNATSTEQGGGSSGQNGQFVGDGFMAFINTLSVQSGWPVKLVVNCESGKTIDYWAYDNAALTSALTDTSGTYSLTAASALTTLQALITNGSNFSSTYQSVRQGTVVITKGGTIVATDCNAVPGTNTSSLVGCGVNGFSVTAGTVGYVLPANALISGLTFTGGDQGGLNIAWTSIQDVGAGGISQQSTYVGYSIWGDNVNPTSGYSTQINLQMTGPPSAIIFQHDGNASDENTTNPPTNNNSGGFLSFQAKAAYTFTSPTKFPANWWWSSNIPLVAVEMPRDSGAYTNIAGARQVRKNMYINQVSGVPNTFYAGGTAMDVMVQCTGTPPLLQSPHAYGGPGTGVTCPAATGAYNTDVWGGARWGRRLAMYAIEVETGLGGADKLDPFISNAAFDNTSTYNAACLSTPHSCINFTVTLLQGTALATCGSNLAGVGCIVTTAVGTDVRGFRIGLSQTAMLAATGEDLSGGAGTGGHGFNVYDSQQFTCKIVAATVIQCHLLAGAWTVGSTYWSFGADPIGARSGTIASSPAFTAGTGGTPGTVNITGTGGGCSAEPTVTVTTSAGGAITAVSRFTPGSTTLSGSGYGCTSAPTFTPAAGTGTITATVLSGTDDINEIGMAPYDNSSASSGPFFITNAGGLTGATGEPGYPLDTVPAIQGPL